VCSEEGLDVLDSAAAVAALVAELIEGDVEFIFSQFVALQCCASVLDGLFRGIVDSRTLS
jgi:hypothetical protein